MKRYLLLLLTAATLLWNTSSHAAGPPGSLGAGDGANDNPHNLSSRQTGTTPHATDMLDTEIDTQICIFCHTPHSATPNSTLWGRPRPIGPYSDYTFPLSNPANLIIDDAGVVGNTHYSTAATEGYPNGASKLCLSCHDGVTAMGVFSSGPPIDMSGTGLLSGTMKIDLATSHPISFIYNTTVEAYLDIARGSNSYIVPAAGSGYLETDSAGVTRVQCTSCHQPHQDTKGTAGGIYPFWRVGGGSAADYTTVCNACHTAPPSNGVGTGHTGYPPI